MGGYAGGMHDVHRRLAPWPKTVSVRRSCCNADWCLLNAIQSTGGRLPRVHLDAFNTLLDARVGQKNTVRVASGKSGSESVIDGDGRVDGASKAVGEEMQSSSCCLRCKAWGS